VVSALAGDGNGKFTVVSVFGPFNSRALVEMSASDATDLVGEQALGACCPSVVINSVLRDLEYLGQCDERLAESALAATALAMAREVEHPFNSATSKSMCAAKLMEATRELRELCPPVPQRDRLDEVNERRERRRAAASRGTDPEDRSGS
jgi:hypothetical protein